MPHCEQPIGQAQHDVLSVILKHHAEAVWKAGDGEFNAADDSAFWIASFGLQRDLDTDTDAEKRGSRGMMVRPRKRKAPPF